MAMRGELEGEWLHLTRVVLPGMAEAKAWPVSADHCFQRIILDIVFEGVWYDHVAGRPAYRVIGNEHLAAAVRVARDLTTGVLDLDTLNMRSLAWRRERRGRT